MRDALTQHRGSCKLFCCYKQNLRILRDAFGREESWSNRRPDHLGIGAGTCAAISAACVVATGVASMVGVGANPPASSGAEVCTGTDGVAAVRSSGVAGAAGASGGVGGVGGHSLPLLSTLSMRAHALSSGLHGCCRSILS